MLLEYTLADLDGVTTRLIMMTLARMITSPPSQRSAVLYMSVVVGITTASDAGGEDVQKKNLLWNRRRAPPDDPVGCRRYHLNAKTTARQIRLPPIVLYTRYSVSFIPGNRERRSGKKLYAHAHFGMT